MSQSEIGFINAMTPAELKAYEKILIQDEDADSPEMTLDEIFEGLLDFYLRRKNKRMTHQFTPFNYLDLADSRRKVCIDMTRMLVTARVTGEKIYIKLSPEEMITDMIEELSAMTRTVRDRIFDVGHFGLQFSTFCERVLLDLYGTIRRLKVTRKKYKDIAPAKLTTAELIGNRLMQSRRPAPAVQKKDPASVQADRAYSAVKSFLPEPDPIEKSTDILGQPKAQSRERQKPEKVTEAPREELEKYVAERLAAIFNSS